MSTLQRLQSPLHSSPEQGDPHVEDPLATAVVAIIDPLKNAETIEQWRARYKGCLPRWKKLRLVVNRQVLAQAHANLDDLQEIAQQEPLTLLSEPAGGAARFAKELLFWLSEETLQAVRRGSPLLNESRFASIEEDIAGIELCWLTLLRVVPPQPAVAEEAAWVAYARARHLRQWLSYIGFDPHRIPREDPEQAGLRALAMVDRLAEGSEPERDPT